MTLQNRVTPFGEIAAAAARGTMMGNRGGKFHLDDRTLGRRRWASHHWICCELHYKGMHHEPMGQGYTSLFFLDEVTALAAGHRPCFYCRRIEAKRFMALTEMKTVDELDRVLHGQREASSSRRKPGPIDGPGAQLGHESGGGTGPGFRRDDGINLEALPDGAMVAVADEAYAVKGRRFLRWSHAGYVEVIAPCPARLLTPPLIAAILAKGYQPRWHESAL
jgi:hypothetical protein